MTLKVDDLKVYYNTLAGDVHALDGVTFDGGKHTKRLDGETFDGYAYYLSYERNTRNFWWDIDYWEPTTIYDRDGEVERIVRRFDG